MDWWQYSRIAQRKREAYEDNVDCTRTATRDGNRHGRKCQYCEENNMEVSLEERWSTTEGYKEDFEDIYWGAGTCVWQVENVGRHSGWTPIVSSACGSGMLGPEFTRKRLDSISTN